MLSGAADDGKKLGGTLVYFEWTIIRRFERSSYCISTYNDVSTFGQVHADMGLALDMVLRMGIPDLLHDGAEAGYVGERIRDLLNFIEKFAWDVQGGPVHQLCCTAA